MWPIVAQRNSMMHPQCNSLDPYHLQRIPKLGWSSHYLIVASLRGTDEVIHGCEEIFR